MKVGGRAPDGIVVPLNESEIRSGLATSRIGYSLHLLHEVDSTNEEAATLATRGAAEGTVVIAEAQRRGRGRLGRRWASPAEVGIYLSVILRPPSPPESAPALSLLGAVAVGEAIERMTGLEAALKWPNDLIVRGKKVAGISGEVATEAARLQHVVLGIGVNVNQLEADFEGELRQTATSLRIELGHRVDRTAMIRSICEGLDQWYDCFLSSGVPPILDRVRRRCLTLGREVVTRSGDEELRGLAVEVDEAGALVIRTADGTLHRLFAGDVTLTG